MTDSNSKQENDKGKKLTLKKPQLTLSKKVQGGTVTQNFQHGRSKKVEVEVKKPRLVKRGATLGGDSLEAITEKLGHLTRGELEARKKLLARLEQEKNSTEKLPEQAIDPSNEEEQSLEVAKTDAEQGDSSIQNAENSTNTDNDTSNQQDDPQAQEEQQQDKKKFKLKIIRDVAPEQLETIQKISGVNAKPAKKALDDEVAGDSDDDGGRRGKSGADRRRSGKITITQALNYEEEQEQRTLAAMRRKQAKRKKASAEPQHVQEHISREVIVPETITVQELSNRMAVRAVDVIKELMKMGSMVTASSIIDADTAELIIEEFGHTIKRVSDSDVEGLLDTIDRDILAKQSRAPIVAVMGHVDHGKTSLLDAFRSTDVVSGEAGGITQHIGAYRVTLENGQKIAFLDTPGHEAFTSMRLRGAKVTDIVVLVVAADDGVMEQTKEAISHAKAAEVPIIVAINKIDAPGADPAKVKAQLLECDLVPEDFGGDIIVVEVSAKQKKNIAQLEENILLVSEMLELDAYMDCPAQGVVVESRMEKGQGVVASLIIQQGILNIGDIVVAGGSYGKVKALFDDRGNRVDNAYPGQPVEILGLDSVPVAGDPFIVAENEKIARDVTEYRIEKAKAKIYSERNKRSLDQIFADHQSENEVKKLALVIKGDVHGSIEAISNSLNKLSDAEVQVNILHSAVGAITESDVILANASGGIVIGFNVRAIAQAKELAEQENIEIRYYSVIYDVIDDVRDALTGMLNPEMREKILGYAEMREIFNVTKTGKVAGCMVTSGMIKRGAYVRLLRDNIVIHEGMLKTLRRFKDDVKEVTEGYECGAAFERYDDIKSGDIIEAFEYEEIARKLSS